MPFGKRFDLIEAARQLTAADKNRITLPVFTYLIDMAERLQIDLIEVTDRKMDKNALKYPVEKARGNSLKYDKYRCVMMDTRRCFTMKVKDISSITGTY